MTDGNWTAAAMPDMDGETVVVTGANSGIGREATVAFVDAGARVVMACRSVDRAEAAAADVRDRASGGSISIRECDLADLSSVQSFAAGLREDCDGLRALCNNAGVMAIPRSETADGFETQFGVNHLGHFALTGHLLPLLAECEGESRVVTQSSGLHERGEIDFDDLHGADDYDRWEAYAQSKLANVLFGYELQRRLDAAAEPPAGERAAADGGPATGPGSVTSVVCHPGYAATNLQLRGPEARGSRLRLLVAKAANAVVAQSAADGALPMLYAATGEDVVPGRYYGPTGFMNMRGAPGEQRSSDRSYDEATAERLWERSVAATGVDYDRLA